MGTSCGSFVSILAVSCLIGGTALAQEEKPASAFSAPHGFTLPGGRSYLGINVGRGYADPAACPATLLFCESRDRPAQLYAGTMFTRNWGAELAYVDTGRVLRTTGDARTQGLSLSLVGHAQLFRSLGVFGKVGTAYGRSDTAVMGGASAALPDQGFGLAYGGGLSYEVTPRLSARVEWDSYDMRLASGPVRATSLGLQYRY